MNGTGSSHRARARRTTRAAANSPPAKSQARTPVQRVFVIATSHLITAIAPRASTGFSPEGRPERIRSAYLRLSNMKTVFELNMGAAGRASIRAAECAYAILSASPVVPSSLLKRRVYSVRNLRATGETEAPTPNGRAPTAHSCQLVTRPAHCRFERFQKVRERGKRARADPCSRPRLIGGSRRSGPLDGTRRALIDILRKAHCGGDGFE